MPISLDTLKPDGKHKPNASSYHDLALAVACQVSDCISLKESITDYLDEFRCATGTGDGMADHILAIKSCVACECKTAIDAWRQDQNEKDADPQTARLSEDDWITLAEAARFSGVTEGAISRAATKGEIKDNEKTHKGRRFHAGSFMRWLKARDKQRVEGESDAQVQRQVDKHVKD